MRVKIIAEYSALYGRTAIAYRYDDGWLILGAGWFADDEIEVLS